MTRLSPTAFARTQRAAPSRAERALWNALRDRRIGYKFRRQVPLGRYIADFVCFEARLIVESAGPHHADEAQRAHDQERDRWLRTQGFKVLRLQDELVVGSPEIAVQRILELLRQR
ncbi:MAG: endonuclease domain-containing protein [Beijerinckiaceae bacterium]